jgi:dihydrofolate synthase/folylpolyglutamate synthase
MALVVPPANASSARWPTRGCAAPPVVQRAVVLAALDAIADKLPVTMQAIRPGLIETELPGRFQVVPGKPAIVLDVGHNPQAVKVLADNLSSMGFFDRTWPWSAC